VFSKKQKGTDNKAIFINENIPEKGNKLRNKPGQDIWLYGGASLITKDLPIEDPFSILMLHFVN
jgi:dihydrofolate reductase